MTSSVRTIFAFPEILPSASALYFLLAPRLVIQSLSMTNDAGLHWLRYKGCRLPHLMSTFRSHPLCFFIPFILFLRRCHFPMFPYPMSRHLRFSLVLYS